MFVIIGLSWRTRLGPARRLAGRAVCLGWGVLSGEARVVSGDSGCESGYEDVQASGTLNRAGLAGGHGSPGFTVIAGAGMLSGSQCACSGDPAAGGGLLAAPQQRVLRVLAITRLVGEFSIHASVEEAASSAGCSRREAVPVPRRLSKIRWPRPAVRSGTQALGSGAR